MTSVSRSLEINITASATWTQMQLDGSNYTVPTGRIVIAGWTAANFSASNSAIVEFAIRSDSSIADADRVAYAVTLAAGAYVEIDTKFSANTGKKLWCKATGTSPNCTFRATILEIT